jgi:hypothetical protein
MFCADRIKSLRLRLFTVKAIVILTAFAWPCPSQITTSASVRIFIDTRKSSVITPGFAGYNAALMDVAFGYADARFATRVRRLGIGWLRYPAGTRSEAFDWRTGGSHPSWVASVSRSFSPDVEQDFTQSLNRTMETLAAKGGEHLKEAARLARAARATGLIICINVFTDTPRSAMALAEYAKKNNIPVLAWELGNEPYFNSRLWPTATDYANAVRTYATAIRKVDPRANIGVAMSDAGFEDDKWDDSLAAYRPRYWNFIIYHHYPTIGGTAPLMIAALNEVLLHHTSDYVRDKVEPRFGKMPIFITEAGPQDGPDPGMSATMYGGIWSSEYALRLSSIPQIKHFGLHQIIGPAGINFTDGHVNELIESWRKGDHLNISSLDFGLYASAQAIGYSLASSTINSASLVYKTTIEGGGSVSLPEGKEMPAVYAQAYKVKENLVVVLTNKGDGSETCAVTIDGRMVHEQFRLVTVSAPDPSTKNTINSRPVARRTSKARDLVSLPPYSITTVSWRPFGRKDRRK